VYPQEVLARAEQILSTGRGLQALLDTGCRQVGYDEWSGWGEDGRSWFSVDTPQLLAEGMARYGSPR
jgi:hypothetical protein